MVPVCLPRSSEKLSQFSECYMTGMYIIILHILFKIKHRFTAKCSHHCMLVLLGRIHHEKGLSLRFGGLPSDNQDLGLVISGKKPITNTQWRRTNYSSPMYMEFNPPLSLFVPVVFTFRLFFTGGHHDISPSPKVDKRVHWLTSPSSNCMHLQLPKDGMSQCTHQTRGKTISVSLFIC